MKLTIYQADAFTDKIFQGNPAAIIPLNAWLPEEVMQSIALENNLSETAFFVNEPEGLRIRWFTPAAEVDLCGHATLATAHILFTELNYPENPVLFHSRSGLLGVEKKNDTYWLDFPSSTLKKMEIPLNLTRAFQFEALECWQGRDDLMLVFETEEMIQTLNPDYHEIIKSECRGVIVTAPGKKVDFVSRFFAPAVGVFEDPVTGSAHTILIPYWAKKLGKNRLEANQISKRSGKIQGINLGDRVKIGGKAITYLKGEIFI